jgi:hypothetical protein
MRAVHPSITDHHSRYYNQNLLAKRAIILIASILAGAALAYLSLPFVLQAHAGTARLQTILDACRSRQPRIVILGNSAGMFGVDARQLSPHALNFCTPAQTLGESLLLERELPASTELVVQIVTFWQLEEESEPDELPVRDRRNVRAALESLARDVLRPDPDRDRLTYDLYFPAPLHPRRSGYLPAELFAGLEHPTEPYVPRERSIRKLRELSSRRRVLFVLAPIHPRVRALRPGVAPRLRNAIAATNATVLDLTELLDASDFIDPTHATLAGARRITDAVGRRIATP